MKNVSTITTISRITERGQITLPKHVRESALFSDVQAIMFVERNGNVTIEPVRPQTISNHNQTHSQILNTTLAGWEDAAHDDLFDFS